MNYPTISEYVESIMLAEDNFDQLSSLRPVLDSYGNPVMSSGNFAVVFKMKDIDSDKFYAVKCFIKDQEGRNESYAMIADELKNVNSQYILPIKFLEKELFVDTSQSDETEFPVLVMDWVEGKTLDAYLREILNELKKIKQDKDFFNLELELHYRLHGLASISMAKPHNIYLSKADRLVYYFGDSSVELPNQDGENMQKIRKEINAERCIYAMNKEQSWYRYSGITNFEDYKLARFYEAWKRDEYCRISQPIEEINQKYKKKKEKLRDILCRFCRMSYWLLSQSFAHGDLKPDNILVRADGSLVLVDYDGFYVPAMEGQDARELGSPDFRHPLRTAQDFNGHIDDFSVATIALSLMAISLDWQLYEGKEQLLLSELDYADLGKSVMMKKIRKIEDEEMCQFIEIFQFVYDNKKINNDYKWKLWIG